MYCPKCDAAIDSSEYETGTHSSLDCETIARLRALLRKEYDAADAAQESHQRDGFTDADVAHGKVLDEIEAALAPMPKSSECICIRIVAADERRHFRECPLRAKYPDPPKENP